MLIDFEIFKPELVQPLDLELTKLPILTVLNALEDLDFILSVYFEVYQVQQNICLILYLPSSFQDDVVDSLEKLPADSPDIVLIEHQSLEHLAQLFASCEIYFESSDSPTTFPYFQMALALNRQILCSQSAIPLFWKESGYYWLFKDRTEFIQQIKDIFSGQRLKSGQDLIGSKLQQLIQQIYNTQIVAIIPWQRSGSKYMHSLLDGHSQVLTLPASIFMHFYMNNWQVMNRYLNQFESPVTVEQFVDVFINCSPDLFCPESTLSHHQIGHPDEHVDIAVDKTEFREALLRILKIFVFHGHQLSRKLLFLSVYYACALIRGDDLSKKTTIVCHYHRADPFQNMYGFYDDFPTLKALLMVRHPVKNFQSNLRYHLTMVEDEKQDGTYAPLIYQELYNRVYKSTLVGWRQLLNQFPLEHLIVSIEKLNEAPRSMLQDVMTFLELSWEDCVLDSTFNGYSFLGETKTASGKHLKLESTPALNSNDEQVLMTLMKKELSEWGYHEEGGLDGLIFPTIFLPTKIEINALFKAFNSQNKAHFQSTILSILERYHFSYQYLFGRTIPIWLYGQLKS